MFCTRLPQILLLVLMVNPAVNLALAEPVITRDVDYISGTASSARFRLVMSWMMFMVPARPPQIT